MSLELVALILGSSVVSSALTLWASRGLRKAEVKKMEMDVSQTASNIYKGLVKDLTDQLDAWKKKHAELVEEFDNEVAKMRKINEELVKINKMLRDQVTSLKREIKELKATH